ncbi:hypothetical protein ES702_03130 [subsurface metagenome]
MDNGERKGLGRKSWKMIPILSYCRWIRIEGILPALVYQYGCRVPGNGVHDPGRGSKTLIWIEKMKGISLYLYLKHVRMNLTFGFLSGRTVL